MNTEYTIDKPLIYRNGRIWQADEGYQCSWLNSLDEKPYQALTRVGYQVLATIEDAQTVIDEQIALAEKERAGCDWMDIKTALRQGKVGDVVRRFNWWDKHEFVTIAYIDPSHMWGVFSDGKSISIIDDMNIVSQTMIGQNDLQSLLSKTRIEVKPPTLCDCGHYAAHPMTTSSGTSCPDCYDRMSNL